MSFLRPELQFSSFGTSDTRLGSPRQPHTVHVALMSDSAMPPAQSGVGKVAVATP
jgi:hypothetical protein